MTAQVAFRTDEALKKSALQKAKREGVTLKAVMTYLMRSYVQGDIELGVVHRDAEGFTKQARETILSASRSPENTSTGSFASKEDLFSHLDALVK